MNWPGYNYLGPGNPLQNGEPVNKTDEIAKKHDYKYDIAKTEEDILKADEEAIKEFKEEFKNSWTVGALAGISGLTIKNQIEKRLGVLYPSNESMSRNNFSGLSLKRKTNSTPEASTSKKNNTNSNILSDSLSREFTMESMDVPDNGNNVIGSTAEGTNKQEKSTEQFRKTITYIANPTPKAKTISFKRMRVMRSWGNAHYPIKAKTDTEPYQLCTSLVWLPVELLEFYISKAEWQSLPYGARVENINVKVTPSGSNVCFNSNANTTQWTNSFFSVLHTLSRGAKFPEHKPLFFDNRYKDFRHLIFERFVGKDILFLKKSHLKMSMVF